MFNEDPLLFLLDFGVPVIAGATQGLGIFDTPGEDVLDGMQSSTDYMLRCESSKFGTLKYGDNVQIGTSYYTVRSPKPLDDGVFCLILLSKAPAPPTAIGILMLESGFQLLLESGFQLLLED